MISRRQVALVVLLVLFIISTATPNWSQESFLDMEFNGGLWEVCGGGEPCEEISTSPALNAVRAFSILAVIGMAAALISSFKDFGDIQQHLSGTIVSSLIAVSVYAGTQDPKPSGYSFILQTIALCFTAVLYVGIRMGRV